MFRCHLSSEAIKGLDNAIALICKEMDRSNSEKIIALAKVLRDIVVARAILTEMTDDLCKF